MAELGRQLVRIGGPHNYLAKTSWSTRSLVISSEWSNIFAFREYIFIRPDLAARRLRLGTMLQFDLMRTELEKTYIAALLAILIGDRISSAFVRIARTASR